MRALDIIGVASTNFRGNMLRTVLTIVGIGVGFATIVFLVSLGYGLQDLSVKQIASIEAVDTLNVSSGKAQFDEAFFTKYRHDAAIGKVVEVNSIPVQIHNDTQNTNIDGVASIVPGDFFGMEGLRVEAGDFYTDGDQQKMVVSTGYLKGITKTSAEVIGQDITVNFFISQGRGSVQQKQVTAKVTASYLDDTSAAVYLTPDFLDTTGPLPAQQVKLKVADRNNLTAKRDELEGQGYSVSSVADTISQLDSIFKVVQIVLGIFGAVALVVAAIGMFNTMTIALLERTRDVGIMKSIGVNNSAVYYMFLTESLLISALGGFSGVLLGWITARVVNYVINVLAQSVGGAAANLFVTPWGLVFLVIGFAFAVGIFTGFMPARRASKLNPLDALRYE